MVTEIQKSYLHYEYGHEMYAFSKLDRRYFICTMVEKNMIYVPLDMNIVPEKVRFHFETTTDFGVLRCPF